MNSQDSFHSAANTSKASIAAASLSFLTSLMMASSMSKVTSQPGVTSPNSHPKQAITVKLYQQPTESSGPSSSSPGITVQDQQILDVLTNLLTATEDPSNIPFERQSPLTITWWKEDRVGWMERHAINKILLS
jgi:hypothetical protein